MIVLGEFTDGGRVNDTARNAALHDEVAETICRHR
jgi:hypothetical protein